MQGEGAGRVLQVRVQGEGKGFSERCSGGLGVRRARAWWGEGRRGGQGRAGRRSIQRVDAEAQRPDLCPLPSRLASAVLPPLPLLCPQCPLTPAPR